MFQRVSVGKLSEHSLSTEQSKTLMARAHAMQDIRSRVLSTELLQLSPNLAHVESLQQLWVEDTKDPSYWGPTKGTGKTSVESGDGAGLCACCLLMSLNTIDIHWLSLAWAPLQGECKQRTWDWATDHVTGPGMNTCSTLPDKQIMISSSCCGILVEKHRQIIQFRPTWKIAWTPCLLLEVKLSRICSTVCSIFWFVGRVMLHLRYARRQLKSVPCVHTEPVPRLCVRTRKRNTYPAAQAAPYDTSWFDS